MNLLLFGPILLEGFETASEEDMLDSRGKIDTASWDKNFYLKETREALQEDGFFASPGNALWRRIVGEVDADQWDNIFFSIDESSLDTNLQAKTYTICMTLYRCRSVSTVWG